MPSGPPFRLTSGWLKRFVGYGYRASELTRLVPARADTVEASHRLSLDRVVDKLFEVVAVRAHGGRRAAVRKGVNGGTALAAGEQVVVHPSDHHRDSPKVRRDRARPVYRPAESIIHLPAPRGSPARSTAAQTDQAADLFRLVLRPPRRPGFRPWGSAPVRVEPVTRPSDQVCPRLSSVRWLNASSKD